jgi:predicted nucleic acid-binding protein
VNPAFLDTSALYAAADPRERAHRACRAVFEAAIRGRDRLVTTELVLAEVHALAMRRSNPAVAFELSQRLATSDRIELEIATLDRVIGALDLLSERPGRGYSLADAVSFVVMRELGLSEAFTLDADFAAEGFAMIPSVGAG